MNFQLLFWQIIARLSFIRFFSLLFKLNFALFDYSEVKIRAGQIFTLTRQAPFPELRVIQVNFSACNPQNRPSFALALSELPTALDSDLLDPDTFHPTSPSETLSFRGSRVGFQR